MSTIDVPASGAPTIADPSKLTPYQLWDTEIAYAEKERSKFLERGRKVLRRYLDERDAVDAGNRWFNLFHANTNILKSALYAQMPKPDVKRKFLDYNDQLARVAANILQRAITPDKDDPRDTFDAVMRHCVLDRLLPGLGTAWLRLETDTEDVELILETAPSVGEGQDHHNSPLNSGFEKGPAPDQPPTPQTFKRITDQRVVVDYVYWEDFIWSPCRVWEERRWVGRVVYMDRPDLVKRFGKELGEKIPLTARPNLNVESQVNSPVPTNMAVQKAKVYEIWDRINRKVIWFCKGHPELLDSKDDFLNLVGFEPCPHPMLANITTSNTIPRPDYYLVQDQYVELDEVNERISRLTKACKVVGVYDRSSEGLQRMLQEGTDNVLIPVDNWAMFAEKGGVKGQVDWLPLEQVIAALQRLYESREAIKQQIYELTGIADIVRGASKASETLGAQQIKAKFASVRIKESQDEVARFASEILRLKAEIMVKHFDPEILLRKSSILHTDDAQMAAPAIELLKSEEGFEWRIEVSSDQLAQADYDMQKQDRIELLGAASTYLSGALPVLQAAPQAMPLLIGLLKWAVSGFKGARDIEGMLDQHLDMILKQPQQAAPNPDAEKAKAELEMKREEHQMDMEGKQKDLQFQQAKQQQDLQANAAKHQQTMQQSVQKMEMDMMQQAIKPQEPRGSVQ